MLSNGSGARIQVFQHQDVAHHSATIVQNTWYTILDTTKNVRLKSLAVFIATAGEDFEVELTTDSGTETISFTAAADTNMHLYKAAINASSDVHYAFSSTQFSDYQAFVLESRTCKIRYRKTTANGANTAYGRALYDRIP